MPVIGQKLAEIWLKKLTGRETEMHILQEYLASGPDYAVLNITGAPGNGKTTLLFLLVEETCRKENWSAVWLDWLDPAKKRFCLTLYGERIIEFASGLESVYEKIINLKGRPPLLLIDDLEDFEKGTMVEKSSFDEFIRRILKKAPVVITSKKDIPEKRHPVEKLHLPPFDLENTRVFLKKHGVDLEVTGKVYQHTRGNLLLLNSFIDSLKKDRRAVLLSHHIITREIADEKLTGEFFKMLEAACIVLSFDRELLSHITGENVEEDLFQQFIDLPFIRTYGVSKYYLAEPFRELFRSHFQKESPKRYLRYRQSAFQYYTTHVHTPAGRASRSYLWERLFLSDIKAVRKLFFTSCSPGCNKEHHIQPAAPGDYPMILEMWHCSMSDQLTKYYPDFSKALLTITLPFTRVMKSLTGDLLGFHTIVPVCGETFPFLHDYPATSAFFSSISPEEKENLRCSAPKTSDTLIILHFVLGNLIDPEVSGILTRDLAECCFRKNIRIVIAMPDFLLYNLASPLGFKIIPGTLLAVLDLRTIKTDFYLEWLVMGRNSSPCLYLLLELSKDEWKKHLKEALANLSSPSLLAGNPLAPLAASLYVEKTEDVKHKGGQGHMLQQFILETINCFKNSPQNDTVLIANLLEKTYIKQTENRENIAQHLGLSPTTYYRWLSKAWNELTLSFLKKAREKLNYCPLMNQR